MSKEVKKDDQPTVKYKRPSGTVIEVADKPANHQTAKKLGWEIVK